MARSSVPQIGFPPGLEPLAPPRRDTCYHVLNRGNARAAVFHKECDYDAFLELLAEANLRVPMRIVAYCLMSNHFHLALWPREDGDLSRWMHWLLTTHVRRYLRHDPSTGHVWQGRFKAFPIQADDHLRVVLRYIERNPLRPAWWNGPSSGVGRAWPRPARGRRSIRGRRPAARVGSTR